MLLMIVVCSSCSDIGHTDLIPDDGTNQPEANAILETSTLSEVFDEDAHKDIPYVLSHDGTIVITGSESTPEKEVDNTAFAINTNGLTNREE